MLDTLLTSLAGIPSGGRAAAATVSGKQAARAAAIAESTRFSDPLLCIMLWAAMLYAEGSLDAKLLRATGLKAAELEKLAARHAAEIEELRWLRLSGMLFSRESLTALLRARLSELLMGATKASEILALTKAIERMPAWMWGEEDASTESGASGWKMPDEDADRMSALQSEGMSTLQSEGMTALLSKGMALLRQNGGPARKHSPGKQRQRRQ